ncbi:hypothetical protein CANCADRAFT_21396 [Tortispora caseinolytica NRRL Y-17796]|uniref:Pheromone alpha factor receptor n=1 Tax=Tortispora caseinolytica NRRL Y-17796 TaxID=767744 RepID=A0A1E4TIF5_9ASCO|nr:hypothetical protein CANCADRAFT_21396 [Tortispora caseinolytica NRRL Y-17796]
MSDWTPMNQSVYYVLADGSLSVFSFLDADAFVHRLLYYSGLFASQIGAGILMAIVILFKIRNKFSLVFFLNELALVLLIIHCSLWLAYLTSNYTTFGVATAEYYEAITTSDKATSIASSVMQYLLVLTVLLSLLFQARVVFAGSKKLQVQVTSLMAAMAVVVMAFWTYALVRNIQSILSLLDSDEHAWYWLTASSLYAAAIFLFSLIFCAKLFFAIRQRRVLGLRQFSAMHILFIMSLQTMIIPAILTIIDVAAPLTEAGSRSLTSLFVCLSLPLSALWASSLNTSANPDSWASTNSFSSTGSGYTEKSYGTSSLASRFNNDVENSGSFSGASETVVRNEYRIEHS